MTILLGNEGVDLHIDRWPDPGQPYGEGAKERPLTLPVPTMLRIAAHYRPHLFSVSRR